jgi:hypothetical protein
MFTEINPEQQLTKERLQCWNKFLDAKHLSAESLQSSKTHKDLFSEKYDKLNVSVIPRIALLRR